MSFWEVYPEVKKGHCQKLLIITGTICFGFCIPILVILAPKKAKKNTFQDSNFGLFDNKNAKETLFKPF